jgi:hypothetical protein
MNGFLSRSGLTALALFVIASVVTVAEVTTPGLPSDPPASAKGNPCEYIFDLEAQESRLVWFFGETNVPSELAEASSDAVSCC